MRYTWNRTKQLSNIVKHRVDFTEVERFAWNQALVRADVRFAYPEPRLLALAPIGDRLHALVFSVERRSLHVISLRKASRKEIDRYEAEIDPTD